MATISIEGTNIAASSNNPGSNGGGAFAVAGHLLIVFTDDTPQEFVIRAGPEFSDEDNFGRLIVDIDPLATSVDSRTNPFTGETLTAAERGNVQLDLGERDANDVFDILQRNAQIISEANLLYNPTNFPGFGNGGPLYNSNGFVGNLLRTIGIDISDVTPDPAGVLLVGFEGSNVDFDLPFVLDGTQSDDILEGGDNNQTFFASFGDDVVTGGFGDDILIGGEGADTLTGGQGNLSAGDTNDVLVAGSLVDSFGFDIDANRLEDFPPIDFNEIEHIGSAARFENSEFVTPGPDELFFTLDDDLDQLRGGLGDDQYLVGVQFDPSLAANVQTLNSIYGAATSGTFGFPFTFDPVEFEDLESSEISFNFSSLDNIDYISDRDGIGSIRGSISDSVEVRTSEEVFSGIQVDFEFDRSNPLEFRLDATGAFGGLPTFTNSDTLSSFVLLEGGISPTGETILVYLADVQIVDITQAFRYPAFAIEDFQNGDFGITLVGANIPSREPNPLFPTTDGDDVINATSEDDVINAAAGDDVIDGGAGDDIIAGGEGADTLIGGDGNDQITIDAADVAFFGGAGRDQLIFDGTENFEVSLNQGSFESIISGSGDDRIFGSDSSDNIDLGDGDDFTQAGDGDDVIVGGAGADVLIGEAGDDTIIADEEDFFFGGGEDRDTLIFKSDANLEYALAQGGFEILISGGSNDRIFGTDGNDDIRLGDGDDFVQAGDGNDFLAGGDGADVLLGDDGNDTILVDAQDTFFAGGEGNDTLIFTGDDDFEYALAQGGFESITTNGGNDRIFGSANNDTINLGAGDDFTQAGDGNDRIQGFSGNDVLSGEGGRDVIFAGQGDDVAGGGDGEDSVRGDQGNDTLFGDAEMIS